MPAKKKTKKLDTYTREEKEKGPFEKALTPLNLVLFIVMAIILALAIIEPSRTLDFVAAAGFIVVIVKIMLDGYKR